MSQKVTGASYNQVRLKGFHQVFVQKVSGFFLAGHFQFFLGKKVRREEENSRVN